MDPAENQTIEAVRPRRRFLSWLRRDPEPSIAAVMAQWLEYELIFNDILTRLSAQLARQAKIEKKRLDRDQGAETRAAPLPSVSTKAGLRSQYAVSRFGSRIQAILADKQATGGFNVPVETNGGSAGDEIRRAHGDATGQSPDE